MQLFCTFTAVTFPLNKSLFYTVSKIKKSLKFLDYLSIKKKLIEMLADSLFTVDKAIIFHDLCCLINGSVENTEVNYQTPRNTTPVA